MLIQAVLDRPLEPSATSSQLLNKLKPVSVLASNLQTRSAELFCFFWLTLDQ